MDLVDPEDLIKQQRRLAARRRSVGDAPRMSGPTGLPQYTFLGSPPRNGSDEETCGATSSVVHLRSVFGDVADNACRDAAETSPVAAHDVHGEPAEELAAAPRGRSTLRLELRGLAAPTSFFRTPSPPSPGVSPAAFSSCATSPTTSLFLGSPATGRGEPLLLDALVAVPPWDSSPAAGRAVWGCLSPVVPRPGLSFQMCSEASSGFAAHVSPSHQRRAAADEPRSPPAPAFPRARQRRFARSGVLESMSMASLPSPQGGDAVSGAGGLDLLEELEAASSAAEVLQVALLNLSALDVRGLAAALYLVARHANAEVNSAQGMSHTEAVQALLRQLIFQQECLSHPRLLAKVLWAIGRLDLHCDCAQRLVCHIAVTAVPQLPHFTLPELSNSLWALARSFPGDVRSREGSSAMRFAEAAVEESTRRLVHCSSADAMSAQSLSNSLWSVARLEMRGPATEAFVKHCVQAVCSEGTMPISSFSSQSLANTLWAVAKLGGRWGADGATTQAISAAVLSEAGPRLGEFQAQELSMLAWAVAKLRGRGPQVGVRGRANAAASAAASTALQAQAFLVKLADVAVGRLEEFVPQGISNIAWALATAGVLSLPSLKPTSGPLGFLLGALSVAEQGSRSYPPQAIANLCWAAGRLSGKTLYPEAAVQVSRFLAVAAQQALARINEFGWQDLSGILVALGQGRHRSVHANALAVAVAHRAAGCAGQLTMQVLLNIALSAARVGAPTEHLQGLVDQIAALVKANPQKLNAMDVQQWTELQQVYYQRLASAACHWPGDAAGAAAAGYPCATSPTSCIKWGGRRQ